MVNDRILKNLQAERDSFHASLKPLIASNGLIEQIYNEFSSFNFDAFQEQLEAEIKQNLKEWWINPEKGILKDERLFAILFEYDTTWWSNREATSYGINKWEDFEIHESDFDMGFDYDFATEFYAAPGLTLSYYKPFEFLDDDVNLEKKYKKGKYLDMNGFSDLDEYVKYYGYVKIHESFKKLHEDHLFKKINMLDKFMFIIGEHDMETNSIFVIEK